MKKPFAFLLVMILICASAVCSQASGESGVNTPVKKYCPYCGEKISEDASLLSVCPECGAILSGDWSENRPGAKLASMPEYIIPDHITEQDGEQIVVRKGDIVECFSGKSAWLAFTESDLPRNAGEDYENGPFFGLHAHYFENIVVFDWANEVTFGKYRLFNAENPSIEYPCEMHFKDDGSKQGSLLPSDEENPFEHWFGENDNVSLTVECNGVTLYFRALDFQR